MKMTTKKYLCRQDNRNQPVSEVSIVDVIINLGVMERLDNTDTGALNAYLEFVRSGTAPEAANMNA